MSLFVYIFFTSREGGTCSGGTVQNVTARLERHNQGWGKETQRLVMKGDRYMRFVLMASVLVLCLGSESSAQSPPFPMVTVTGKTAARFNRVSLFASGGLTVPIKTEDISAPDRHYSIQVNIPADMHGKDSYFFTDMRFWGDTNGNGVKDPDEPLSQCHFIIWSPAAHRFYMQVYQGKRYPIKTSVLNYDYEGR